MELLRNFKTEGFFNSTLYHLIVRKKMMPSDTEITPSEYLKEMRLSTAERLQKLNSIVVSNLVLVEENQDSKVVLEFTPRIIIFQNFKQNDKVVAKFTVKNISNAPTFLNMKLNESSHFFIKACGTDLLSRLAPGIGVTFAVTFSPRQYKDYAHQVSFYTDKQQYVIPLIAMGPRPIFDFPDEIVIPSTPLKVDNSATVFVHNVASIAAGFTIDVKCPFSAHPKYNYMRPNTNIALKVTFKSMHLGESVGKMIVTLETEERFVIKLLGKTHTVSIELEKAVVRFFDTYNTMVRQQDLKITNRSNHVLTYMCMKNENIFQAQYKIKLALIARFIVTDRRAVGDFLPFLCPGYSTVRFENGDFEDKIKLAKIFYDAKDTEADKCLKLVHYDVLTSAEHERVYTRVFFDEIQSLVADESLFFNDSHFSVSPIKGNLWPNEATAITVTFSPTEIGDFVAVAFLDIDGISERVPLTIQGTSLAPNIHLNIEMLDMDKVYINKTYNYEIIAINKGHINGVIQYKEMPPLFGSVISCSPEMRCLCPGEREVFVVSFLNSNQGPYFEELTFVIRDTNIVRKLCLKGTIIYPTITFSIPCLDFGNVHVGVPKTLLVDVINESEVNVNGILKVSSDGPEISSITLEDCEACENIDQILALPQWPKEFVIDPPKIALGANSTQTVRVTLTPNLARNNQTFLELELDKSESPPITLPISFNARVPDISCAPDIKLRAGFLEYLYQYDVNISSNEFWGYYIIHESEEGAPLQVNVGNKRGIIRPNTTISIPVSISTNTLGCHEHVLRMHLFGSPQVIDICNIKVQGVRPIVTCTPLTLHFGHVKLLTKTQRTLCLSNDSPVTVYFKTGILNRDGRWSIEPAEGCIEPESETDLMVHLCLIDANTYSNKAVVHLEKVKDLFVPLAAVGVGTSILVGPDRDHVNLGRHFIKIPLEFNVEMENCGTRLHSLEWVEHYKLPKLKAVEPKFFNMQPRVLKIGGGETMQLKITGLSTKNGFIQETWYLVGSVEGVNKKELLMECEISGEFVEPKIIFSTTDINLHYHYGPYSEYYKLTDILTIKNISRLPITIDMIIKPPFAFVHREETYKIDSKDVDMCCCISYDESDISLQEKLDKAIFPESKQYFDCITNKFIPRSREGSLPFFQNIHKIKQVYNFTQVIEQVLEDEEVMKLQIVFDTTKHTSLKSKLYTDIMRIKLRGHKNKFAVRLTGKINFPNVVIYTPKLDFECILNGIVKSKTITIHNPTSLLVCYKYVWRKCHTTRLLMPEELKPIEIIEKASLKTVVEKAPSGTTEDTHDVLKSTEDPENIEGGESRIMDLEQSISVPCGDTAVQDHNIVKTKFLQKITPMLPLEKESDYCDFIWGNKLDKREKQRSLDINELFHLAPHYGRLAPGETHHTHVIFRPVDNICVRGLLELKVLGGPSEFITVFGQSSELVFKLNTQILNFKIRSFHENASENLVITNIAKLSFELNTYLNEPMFENELPAKIIELDPSNKVLVADEEVEIAVVVRPGVLGYFKRQFLLEIGFLEHIPIEVFGWGVVPQIYFMLPRPSISKLNVEIGYDAIATLTVDYLAAVNEIFVRGPIEHLNSPQLEKCFEDPDFQDGWHICSAWDGYPSVMDIELAIERLLVVRHIKARSEIMNMYMSSTKIIPIPGFHTIPFVVDFGVVITGNTVTCVIDTINYGPIPVKLHNVTPKTVQYRQYLSIKMCGKLNPGETGKIELTFFPIPQHFPEVEQYLDLTLSFEVPYGVIIPLNIKALCAVPFLKSSISILDFGSVRCGDKIICSVPLANVGKPACIWYVTLKMKTPGDNPMVILGGSGKYEPGEGGWLSIAFKPTMEMLYQGMLVFRFHMNPTKMTIPVIGQGLFPHLHIIGPHLNFPPTLPWAETTEIFFGITNPCAFPIELIIAHVDSKWKEDEELFNLLYRYYNKPEEILVPALKPGEGMPEEINNFYCRFKANVQKGIEEEAAFAAKLASARGAAAKGAKGKKKESPIKPVKGGKDKETSPMRQVRTESEIVADEIKAMKEQGLDPLKDSLHIPVEDSDEAEKREKYEKGLLLFLYGSPGEEIYCKEMAYTLGMRLNIPTVNLDSCIVEALLSTTKTTCLAKTIINTALNDNYEYIRQLYVPDPAVSLEDVSQLDPYEFGPHLDEYEIIQRKIDAFGNNNKTTPAARSKANDKKKNISAGASQHVMGNAMSMFQMELVEELLRDYFDQEKFSRGFVMDSLTSNVIKFPTMALTTVLNCKNTIYNIHLVLCQGDFSKWVQKYEEALREAELAEEKIAVVPEYSEEQIEKIVEGFEEMDGDEYENSDPDLRAIYIKKGLEERRKRHYQKFPSKFIDPGKKEKNTKEQGDGLQMIPSDSKKKGKKEETRGKPGVEYMNMQLRYNEYHRNTYEGLIAIACNWDVEAGDLCMPLRGLNGQVVAVSQKKSKKVKSEVRLMATGSDIVEEEKDKGFPLTLMFCPCLEYKDALVEIFKCPYIQKRLQTPEKFDILQCPGKRQEFSVLLAVTMPAIHDEPSLKWRFLDEAAVKKCECNQITDLNLLDDTTQENVLNILSKWHCVCGKKMASSQTSTSNIPSASALTDRVEVEDDMYFYPLPVHSVKSIDAPVKRIVLQPGDLMRCKYAFSPTVEGNFSIKRYVEVAGWPESRIDINVTGICDLPRLDNRPKKMFSNFVRRTVEGEVYKLTFLDDRNKFEFGPIFIGKNRIYEEQYTIEMKNASLLTADVIIEFMTNDDIFTIDKDFISLEPGCRGQLTVTAAPPYIGEHETWLLFCIKDNPEIIKINISCSGVVPVVEILPLTKIIDYGKLLLYRREDERFIVKNDSILPIMWKIRNPEDFVEDFIISRTTGVVPRYENHVVPVTYIACNVGIISQLAMIIDIYDELGRGEPMIVDSLWLSGECYDVMVECAYENPYESFLNFGNVKVNSTVFRDLYLLNRGKYNIYYKLKKVKKFPEPSLLKSFECDADCGMILPGLKLTSIEFSCTPTTSVNLNNVPAYICSLLDGSKDQVVVAKFPIYITIASFYNTFTLFPLGELNFHIIPVGSGVLRDVILNNTSKCPFNYEIVVPQEYRVDPETLPPPKPGKDAKVKNPPLKCGNFLIMNEDNLLAPGTSRTIQIQFSATSPTTFEETIHFIVSDTCPAEARGVPLKLVGTGAMPILDFWNVENTFREHLIVKNMNEYKVPESSPHCVFDESTVTFNFFCVTVNTTFSANIDLYNNGLVPCILTLYLTYQQNTNADIFSVDKSDVQIEPLMHKRIEITFAPKELVKYSAVLNVKLKLLENKEQTFQLCLLGEGVIPRISLIKPPVRQHRLALITFPVTCLGSVTNQCIRIKNISTVNSTVTFTVLQAPDQRPVFWMKPNKKCKHMILGDRDNTEYLTLCVLLKPTELAEILVYFNPLVKGRTNCDIQLKIEFNPYEYFTVMCEAEAFMEDVILVGLEMLSMDVDIDAIRAEAGTGSGSGTEGRKKIKSAPTDKQKSKDKDKKKFPSGPNGEILEPAVLKYILDFGGCELATAHKRTVVMLNNSEKAYKFMWGLIDNIVIKPAIGYISPGEEKDIEITFFSTQPVAIKKELLNCNLIAISNDSLTLDVNAASWDNRQMQTFFGYNPETGLSERHEAAIDEPNSAQEDVLGFLNIIILYSATTEFTKYFCDLEEIIKLPDTYIYQKRNFEFKVDNIGLVPIKISWDFFFEDEYPGRIDRRHAKRESRSTEAPPHEECSSIEGSNTRGEEKSLAPSNMERSSKETMYSVSMDRESVDTWFEVDIPFSIEPKIGCLNPQESQIFTVTFSPLEVFEFTVRMRSHIDNLDPYDQNISSKIMARSLTPYVHLDIEESDYLTSEKRKSTGMKLPDHMQVLEFNVLGTGCYKKTFQVINPTSEGYDFMFQPILVEDAFSTAKDFVPVHCNKLKGYIEGGTSDEVTFTFSPTTAGVYESQWKFVIPVYKVSIPLMVVGIVREPDVVFVPTILIMKNSLVGFTSTHTVQLKNNENEPVPFEFKGHSIYNETGVDIIEVRPNRGILKPRSETSITIYYTAIQDGPISFKIFCAITNMMRKLTLCVNALSHLIKPTVTYYLIGNEHLLDHNNVTNIHLEQTASTYERTIPFKIKNDGSATFTYEWNYVVTPVKKYLTVCVEPRTGFVAPGTEQECDLRFNLKIVPVIAYPVTLSISNGPQYQIYLYAEIEKPSYHFSIKEYDFGKCIINAPDRTYKKNLAFTNDDKDSVILDLATENTVELYVDYRLDPTIQPKQRAKIPIFFRPKQIQQYEFKLQFWVNSLCEEIITIRGEGVPLLVDLYEGCQKSFDLGPVKVGEKIVREIDVINYSKVPIDCSFIFKEVYPYVGDAKDESGESLGSSMCLESSTPPIKENEEQLSRVKSVKLYRDEQQQKQIEMDITHALASLKVIPAKCVIQPHMKVPLKIVFKPVGLISELNVQLNVSVLMQVRPLVLLSGSATGMSLCFSQNSLQFGRVRKRGCRILKVMLLNKGDFNAKFWWQPLTSEEFKISPMSGVIDSRTNVTFSITYRPLNYNPFVKVWASCNIANYKNLDLALYAACVDYGVPQNQSLYMECPTREVITQFISVTNPTDETWLVLSEMSGESAAFETLREFNVDANSTFDIPIIFKPKTFGNHEGQALYSPLGETALFVTLIGNAMHPNPNGVIDFEVEAKKSYTENLLVYNITENPEVYIVTTELVKVVPEKFEGNYEIKYPETVKVWGEAKGTCKWTFVCFEPCEMVLKVMFVNEESREYQYYLLNAQVTPSLIMGTLTFNCRARESVQQELTVPNPLNEDAEYLVVCNKLNVSKTILVARQSQAKITMTYSPLVVGESEDFLTVENSVIGTCTYRVITICKPAKQKSIELSVPFGSMIPSRLRVRNRTNSPTTFYARTDHPSIITEPKYDLPAYEKGKFLVYFEPTELGVQNVQVAFDSDIAGEFVFNIKGIATEPKPLGPYEIKAGGFTTIRFKNVFEETRTFRLFVDREEFYIKSQMEQIKSKKEIKVVVYLSEKPVHGWTEPPTGCLNIENFDPVDPKVQWTYFLQGKP